MDVNVIAEEMQFVKSEVNGNVVVVAWGVSGSDQVKGGLYWMLTLD